MANGLIQRRLLNGATNSQSALNIATGAVFTECKPRHRHQEVLSFLRSLEACVPAELEVHLVVDNYALTSIPRCAPGWRNGLASTCITPPPTRRG
jgi:putative transposase